METKVSPYALTDTERDTRSIAEDEFYLRLSESNNFPLHGENYYGRDEFKDLFPESVVTLALQTDPTTKYIDISEPSITPRVMAYVVEMLRSKRKPNQELTDGFRQELVQADRYLGLHLLSVFADTQYEAFLERFNGQPLVTNLEPSSEKPRMYTVNLFATISLMEYDCGLNYCISVGYDALARYLLARVPASETSRIDSNHFYHAAVTLGATKILQYLLHRDINPGAWNNRALDHAVRAGNTDAVKILLRDDRVDPSRLEQSAFLAAVRSGHEAITEMFLQHPRIDIAYDDHAALDELGLNNCHLRVIRMLLEAKADPSSRGHAIIRGVMGPPLDESKVGLCRLFLAHPKVNPSFDGNWLLKIVGCNPVENTYRKDLLRDITGHSRFDPNNFDYSTAITSSEDVRDMILQHPKVGDEMRTFLIDHYAQCSQFNPLGRPKGLMWY
jgi:hypothetical protein